MTKNKSEHLLHQVMKSGFAWALALSIAMIGNFSVVTPTEAARVKLPKLGGVGKGLGSLKTPKKILRSGTGKKPNAPTFKGLNKPKLGTLGGGKRPLSNAGGKPLPNIPGSKPKNVSNLPPLGKKPLPDLPGVKPKGADTIPVGRRPRSNANAADTTDAAKAALGDLADIKPPKSKLQKFLGRANMVGMPLMMGAPLILGQVLSNKGDEKEDELEFDENGNPINGQKFDVEAFKYQAMNGLPFTSKTQN